MNIKLYEVCFYHTTTGEHTRSRIFQTIKAARKWATWLAKLHYTSRVEIFKGGAGGEVVQ